MTYFFLLVLPCYFTNSDASMITRDGAIVSIPIEAFNSDGKLIDKEWFLYLKHRKPIGIIFFADHFKNKMQSKKIIQEIKDAIGDNVILAADEEGGRVNRIKWIHVNSAEYVALRYKAIKQEYGKQKAIEFVRMQYAGMFQEMRELGLNTTFAPNLDLNKYVDLDKNSNEYKNYRQCERYIKLFDLKKNNKINKNNLKEAELAELFFVFLEEKGIRKLNDSKLNKEYNEKIRIKWRKLTPIYKDKLSKKFDVLTKYINYISVIGDRSFGGDAELVGEVAEIFVDTAREYGINCVMKHAPGHGSVDGDTHFEKQRLKASSGDIMNDIKPYQRLSGKVHYIMPSHIIYEAIDDRNSAVNSEKVLNFIRKYVDNDVIFITDDLSMKGALNEVKSPCDLWIITSISLEKLKKISELNQLNQKQINRIFSKMIL